MNFPADSSTQTNTALATTGTSYNYVNSNDLSTKQDILDASTNLLGIGTSISALNYNNISLNKPTNFQSDWNTTIINKPDLTLYAVKSNVDNSLNLLNTNKQNVFTCIAPLIKNDVSNNISIDLSAYTTTGNDPSYLLKTGGTMTGTLIVNAGIPNIQLGGTNGHNLGVATAAGYFSASAIAGDMILRSRNKLILQSGTTAGIIIDTSNNVGIGTTTNTLYKLTVDGAFNSTSLYNNGTLINFNSYATNTNLTTNYYNKSSTDSLLNTKQDTLLFTSPLLKDISNNVTIDLSAYPLKTSVDSSLNSLNTNKQNVFTCISPLIKNDISNNISVDLSAYPLKTNVDSSLNTIDTTLGTKENILTFSAPLTRTTNTIGIDLSSYSTTGNDTNYLLKTGGVMTGQITGVTTLNGTTGIFGTISTTNNSNVAIPSLGIAGGTGDKLILYPGTASIYPYSIGINNSVLWYSVPSGASHKFYNNGTNTVTIDSTGLSLSTASGNNPIYISSTATDANNCIRIKNNSTYNAYIGIGGTAFNGNYANNLFIESAQGSIIFNTNGRTSSSVPNMKINNDGHIETSGYIYAGGTPTTNALRISGNDTGNTIYQGSTTVGANIGFTLRDTNSFNFQSFSSAGAYTTIVSMNTNGVSLFGNLIYNYLFNNTGGNHGDITDFNNVTHFGYKFIQGNTNGPGTLSTFNQYYQWFIGIGANYGASGASSYGCQFALPRYTGQPELSVRFKENNVWTDWFGIQSTGVKMPINTWAIASKDGKSRMGNLNNGATLFRGYGTPTLADNAFEFRNTADSLILNISDSGNASLAGRFSARFLTIANTNRDLLGINFENTQVGNENNATIYCIQGTFTGFHRCFTEDELFDKNNPQVFKDNYEGRIVISTGKIATDTNDNNEEWVVKYDKDGITIEDALPQIELSRKKKDKRVFGVIGDRRRNNSRPERLIINSVGEGALYVINSNGNIENGDYITSSDYMGYGEKQDDDLLHNYTVAKATMDCNFELDSNLYNCLELENGMRIAFIAVTYHCA